MLVLTRKTGEQLQIGDGITVTVVRTSHNSVKIGIEAPPGVTIFREELSGDDAAQELLVLRDDSDLADA